MSHVPTVLKSDRSVFDDDNGHQIGQNIPMVKIVGEVGQNVPKKIFNLYFMICLNEIMPNPIPFCCIKDCLFARQSFYTRSFKITYRPTHKFLILSFVVIITHSL